MANETEEIEEAQIELRAAICRLRKADFRELSNELHIKLKEKDTGRRALIQTVTKYLDTEELVIKKLKLWPSRRGQKDWRQRLKVNLMTKEQLRCKSQMREPV